VSEGLRNEGPVSEGLAAGMRSYVLGHVVVDELVRAGVEHVVLAPGSRSAPIAVAADRAARSSRLRLHVRVDERSAGFTALGLAKASRRPVAVVTTSGTAVANLHPAVLEARHSQIGLLVVSADRPAAWRLSGANQTTDQSRMFGPTVGYVEVASDSGGLRPVASWRSLVCRALDAARSGGPDGVPGPVQLDVCLGEPLLPPHGPPSAEELARGDPATAGRPDGKPWTDVLGRGGRSVPTRRFEPDRRTVLIAGDAAGHLGVRTWMLAREAGWPLIAEPSSNARVAPALRFGRLLLGARHGRAAALVAEVERVLVVGRPTLSRGVSALLARSDVEVVVCAPGPWPDVAGTASMVLPDLPVLRAVPALTATPGWADRWSDVNGRLAAAVARTDVLEGLDGRRVAALVADTVTVSARGSQELQLFAGPSQPVRDLDLAPVPVGAPTTVTSANRGLAGIDGVLSTAVGTALATGPTIALVGDLTYLHDANGLLLGPGDERPDLRVVVLNDDGGAIFHPLEPGASDWAESFERVFGTPTGADLSARSAAVGVPHCRVSTRAELHAALDRPVHGIDVVEVLLPRAGRREEAHELQRLVDDLS